MTSIEELAARLDKQAAAIVRLRKDRDSLIARVAALEAGQDQHSATASTVGVGTYLPNAACAMCGKAKEKGRTALTCKDCAARRSEIISSGADRAPITRDTCFSCGAGFKAQTRFLCRDCGTGHKIWAAQQR